MPRIDLDPQTAERLIAGRAGDPADLPRGAAEVAHLLDAARRATTERDDGRMAATVAAMRDVLVPGGGRPPARVPTAARRPHPAALPRLMAAGAAGLTVLFGGLAAAGALPAAAQKPVADLVSHVGIDLPRPESPASTETPAATPTTSTSTTSTTIPVIVGVAPNEAPTSETTVTAPACPPPAYQGPNGCVTPLPVPETTTTPPTTTPPTTVPPPPPTTTTSTTVPSSGGSTGGRSHGDIP